jgi:glycosyltransferase involved in cell wall biosynthesis
MSEPAPPIRVMQLLYSLGVGGSEKLALSIASHLDRDRFEFHFCGMDHGGELTDDLDRQRIPHHLMNRKGLEARVLGRLHRVIKQNRIQVVHSHHFTQLFYGGLPARLAGARIVHTEHEFFSYSQSEFSQMAIRPLSRLCEYVTAVGPEVADFFTQRIGLPRRLVTVVPNGVDVKAFEHDAASVRRELGLNAHEIVIGTVGRLEPEKDQTTLLEMFRQIEPATAPVRLMIVGSGAKADELKATAHRLGIADRTLFLGLRHDVPRLLSAMDVFVLTSIREGLPISLVEAMAARLPVVASNVGSIRDLVREGQTGFVVPARDVASFKAAVDRLVGCRDLRRRLGESGRSTVEQSFSLSSMIRSYEDMYLSAAQRSHVRN